jgi:hypothetical protein
MNLEYTQSNTYFTYNRIEILKPKDKNVRNPLTQHIILIGYL